MIDEFHQLFQEYLFEIMLCGSVYIIAKGLDSVARKIDRVSAQIEQLSNKVDDIYIPDLDNPEKINLQDLLDRASDQTKDKPDIKTQ